MAPVSYQRRFDDEDVLDDFDPKYLPARVYRDGRGHRGQHGSQDLECGSRCVIQRNFPAPAWPDLKTFAPQPVAEPLDPRIEHPIHETIRLFKIGAESVAY